MTGRRVAAEERWVAGVSEFVSVAEGLASVGKDVQGG